MAEKLSAVITTYNNEPKIMATLESIKWADEIIIVDGHSNDKTVEICKRYTTKIYSQPNYPQWNINKNYGFQKANGGWILNLDSDEIITGALRNEIKLILEKGTECDYFYIPRREHFFGKWIKSIWGPEPLHIKLFKKGMAEYECWHLHEAMITKGKRGVLKNHIVHNAYINLGELLGRIDAFTDEEAKCMKVKGFRLRWRHFIIKPARYMFYAYIKKKGFRNGFRELLTIILWCGYYWFITLVKLKRLENNK
ncbi:MAG: glycosyltransferase family 2 protein [Candidatus Omnitrophota bacterium]